MKNITPVILVRSLNVRRGGITKASIKRANLLSEKHNEVIIVTFLYQQYHKKIIGDLYDKGMLSKKVKVVNFFEDMKPKTRGTRRVRSKEESLVKEKGFTEFPVKDMDTRPSYRYYKDGLYYKYKRFNKDGSLSFIDYMDSSRHRIKREEFNEQGMLVRIRKMDKINNKPRFDQYFNKRGYCYLSVHVNPKNGKDGRTAHFNNEPKEFDTLYSCQQEWLSLLLNDLDYPVVTCELRGLHNMLRNVQHDNIKKIEVIHSNHLEAPFDDHKNIKKNYIRLFEHANEFDQIVFLTNEQRQDVEFIYGKQKNFNVIPHACEKSNKRTDNKKKSGNNSQLAVTLARYHEDKRLDEAINAFKYVVEKIPEARYYIYGYGALKEELQALINRLDLKDNVFLKKYTLNPEDAYGSAACSILTSRQEGFAMVITESMSAGTPVISYNIKYGPNDIIDDGENGYLVPNGDQKELAKKIIHVMEDEVLHEKLSKNALNICNKFSEENYREQWLNLIKK